MPHLPERPRCCLSSPGRTPERRQVDPAHVLTRTRDALVADLPGVTVIATRHRPAEPRSFVVVDTGGIADSDEAWLA